MRGLYGGQLFPNFIFPGLLTHGKLRAPQHQVQQRSFSHGIDGSVLNPGCGSFINYRITLRLFSYLYNGDNSVDCNKLFGGLNAIRQFKS